MMLVDSKNTAFAQTLRAYGLVQEVGKDFGAKAFPRTRRRSPAAS